MNSPRVAIIADDLTGALDVCAPFARRGLTCRIAVTPAGLTSILSRDADVICVNTASRELDAGSARDRVAAVARQMAEARPSIVFKKIDSRLKGHVSDETEACLAAFARTIALVAPAVPLQGRLVRDGRIVGKGVAAPIDIAERLSSIETIIADSETPDDMEHLARQYGGDVLMVGASGLGDGLARALTDRAPSDFLSVALPLLVAVGSHDPVTLDQLERLGTLPGLSAVESLDGDIAETLPATGVTLLRAVSSPDHPEHGPALARFGHSIAEQLRSGRFASALLCGGETAQTVLDAVGIVSLELIGEALPGIPLCQAQLGGHTLTILTKSGGFGTPGDLLRIAETARNANPSIDPTRAGIPA